MYVEDLNSGDICIDTQNRLHRVAAKPAPDTAFIATNLFNGLTFSTRPDIVSGKNHAELRVGDIAGVIRVERIE